MSAQWDAQDLLQPITPDQPCGESLEDTLQLAAIGKARLFGQQVPFDAARNTEGTASPYAWKPPVWDEFKRTTLDALRRSKDLRVLANFAVVRLRADGIEAFLETLPVAAHWLETFWADTYPRLEDGDATLRRSALNCFADPMAVVDGLRRLPLVRSQKHGVLSFRDIDLATGPLPPPPETPHREDPQVEAALLAIPADAFTVLQQTVEAGSAALRRIETTMSTLAGPDAVPSFEPLSKPLWRMEQLLHAQAAKRSPSTDVTVPRALAASTETVGYHRAVGTIASRDDAIRALDAVAEYFIRNEPSSPVPIFIERAKRLVAKSFLEVLADVVPEALPQARVVGGVTPREPGS